MFHVEHCSRTAQAAPVLSYAARFATEITSLRFLNSAALRRSFQVKTLCGVRRNAPRGTLFDLCKLGFSKSIKSPQYQCHPRWCSTWNTVQDGLRAAPVRNNVGFA